MNSGSLGIHGGGDGGIPQRNVIRCQGHIAVHLGDPVDGSGQAVRSLFALLTLRPGIPFVTLRTLCALVASVPLFPLVALVPLQGRQPFFFRAFVAVFLGDFVGRLAVLPGRRTEERGIIRHVLQGVFPASEAHKGETVRQVMPAQRHGILCAPVLEPAVYAGIRKHHQAFVPGFDGEGHSLVRAAGKEDRHIA